MKTKVVNLRKEEYDIYIGRHGVNDGYFGNPFKIGSVCDLCGEFHKDGGATLPCYKIYFNYRIENDNQFKQEILKLKGKRLGCFCFPKPCHGNVIIEYLESVGDKNE